MKAKVFLWGLGFATVTATLPAIAAKGTLAYQNYTRGVELAARKKWEAALEKFQASIDLNPAYVASHIEWARASAMLGRRRAALEKLTAALAFARDRDDREKLTKERENLSDIFYTNDTFQQYQNGLNQMKLDHSGSAVDALEKALKTEPDNVSILAAYAQALQREERHKEALAALEQAFSLNDGKREVRVDLAEASLPQNPERTLMLLRPLLEGLADERVSWLHAQALSALKRNKEAIEFLRVAFERQGNWVYAPFWLGKLYSFEDDGAWNARKYLMIFLKRSEPAAEKQKADLGADARKLRATRTEAETILERVNRSLE